jgi:hypothetical protein
MKWSSEKNTLKIIFMVGNETARQGPGEFDYTKTAKAAIEKEIIVNAVYCGDQDRGSAPPTWQEIARIADGRYQEIGAQGGAVSVATPFDAELADLSTKLNSTYVAFGKGGRDAKKNQQEQDKNAQSAGSQQAPQAAEAERALAKSSAQYRNSRWDLVDALKEKEVDLDKLGEDDLPEEMKKMSPEERKAHVEKKAQERAEIQTRIREIAAKRDAFIQEEIKKQGLAGDKSFDEAVKKTMTEQAGRKGDAFGR